jgi:hypothetical protein
MPGRKNVSNLSDDNPDVAAAATVSTSDPSQQEPVLVYDAPTGEEAEVVRATLEASGIPAILGSATVNSVVGALDPLVDTEWTHGVFVSPSNLEAARAILNAASPSEEELAAEEEADPTTLAEAEARINRT